MTLRSCVNPNCALALWRSDRPGLEYFGCFRGAGSVTLNVDKTVEFYAGNVAVCDPALVVSVVIWNHKESWFRVHNPTKKEISSELVTAAIQGSKSVRKRVSVPAGAEVEVRE
jgi:hypothetical protein